MQGILENIPVALMAMLMDWPLVAVMLGLPAVLAIIAWRRGTFRGKACWPWVSAGFVAGALLGPPLLPGVMEGGFAALGYWLDWAFLAAIAAGAGLYLALIIYLVMPRPAGRTAQSLASPTGPDAHS
jgi:hypothetical protein